MFEWIRGIWSNSNQLDGFSIPARAYNEYSNQDQALLAEQVAQVEQAFTKLLKIDLGFIALHGAVSFWAGLSVVYEGLGNGLVYWFLTSKFERSQQAESFQKELSQLYSLYKWCAKNGSRVTYDEHFKKMFQILAVFIPTEEIECWDDSEMSLEYKQVLASPPHNMRFQNVEYKASSGLKLFEDQLKKYSFIEYMYNKIPSSPSTERLVAHVIAEARLWMYGVQKSNALQQTG